MTYEKMKAQKEMMKEKETDRLIKERITKLRIDRGENTPMEKIYDTIDMLWEAREKLHRENAELKQANGDLAFTLAQLPAHHWMERAKKAEADLEMSESWNKQAEVTIVALQGKVSALAEIERQRDAEICDNHQVLERLKDIAMYFMDYSQLQIRDYEEEYWEMEKELNLIIREAKG